MVMSRYIIFKNKIRIIKLIDNKQRFKIYFQKNNKLDKLKKLKIRIIKLIPITKTIPIQKNNGSNTIIGQWIIQSKKNKERYKYFKQIKNNEQVEKINDQIKIQKEKDEDEDIRFKKNSERSKKYYQPRRDRQS